MEQLTKKLAAGMIEETIEEGENLKERYALFDYMIRSDQIKLIYDNLEYLDNILDLLRMISEEILPNKQ